MKFLLCSLLILTNVFAIEMKEEDFINEVYSEIYNRTKDIKVDEPKITEEKSVNKGSRGQMILEQIKAKNRLKLAKMRGLDPRDIKSGKDIISGQIKDNKNLLSHAAKIRKELEAVESRVITNTEWRARFALIRQQWDEAKRKYLSTIKVYEKGLSDIPLILPVSEKEKKKIVNVEIKKEFTVVDNSFDLSIRDQSMRPTCSAFTGVRAVEIAMVQKGKSVNLSEQYLYWASKPKCQSRPCSQRGSWIGFGLTHSKKSAYLDIPLEKDCPYSTYTKKGNETQTPLKDGCRTGVARIKSFTYLQNLDQVVNSLEANKAVIASVRLTPNFYKNNGLILESEKDIGKEMDDHSFGHSILINGVIKLPSAMNEGKYCFVVTNSWGKGWGLGGFSCISEKWLLSQRQSNPFVVINSVFL